MLPQVTQYLFENWKDIFPELEKKPSRIDYLGMVGSKEGGKTSFLAFIEKRKKPIFIIQILRDPTLINEFLNNRDILLYLHSSGDFFKNSVPKIILFNEFGGSWYCVQAILEGEPMRAHLARNGLPNLKEADSNFNLVKNWLTEFSLKTRSKDSISNIFIKEKFFKLTIEFQQYFRIEKAEKEYLEKILEEIVDQKNAATGLSFRHGDFCRHNILVGNDSKIKVIDWKFSQKNSFPLYDLLFFIITYFQQLREKGKINDRLFCLNKTFFEKNDYSSLVSQLVKDYCKELKIDTSLIKLFFVNLILEKAIFEQRVKEQIWINFFHFSVKNDSNFIL